MGMSTCLCPSCLVALCNEPGIVAWRWRMQTKTTPGVRSLVSPNPMANDFPWLRFDVKQTSWNTLWETFSCQVVPWGWFTEGAALPVMAEAPALGVKSLITAHAFPFWGAQCEPEVLHSSVPGLSQEQQLCQDQSGFLLGLSEDASKDNFF